MYRYFFVLLCSFLFFSSSFTFANATTLLPTEPESFLIKFSGEYHPGGKGFVELEDGTFGIYVDMRIRTDETASAGKSEIVTLKEGSLFAEGNELYYENGEEIILVGKKLFLGFGYPKWLTTNGAKIVVKSKIVSWDLIYSIYLQLP